MPIHTLRVFINKTGNICGGTHGNVRCNDHLFDEGQVRDDFRSCILVVHDVVSLPPIDCLAFRLEETTVKSARSWG